MHLDETLHETLVSLAEGHTTPGDAAEKLKGLLSQGEDGLSEAARLLMASQYDTLADTLAGLVAGVKEFEGVSASSEDELDRHLQTASNRFAIQLSAALFDTPFVEGTLAGNTASTSVRNLKGQLGELGMDRITTSRSHGTRRVDG